MGRPEAGIRRATPCWEKYWTPQPTSPDHSSGGASGRRSMGAKASSFSQGVMLPSRLT